MKKKLVLVILLIIWLFPAFSQDREALKKDSTMLDSLKKLLPYVRDHKKVDILNEIAARSASVISMEHVKDSTFPYAQKAYDEASKLGYKEGIALALLHLSVETLLNWVTDSIKASKESNIRKAIQIGEESRNNEILGYG